MGDPLTLCVLYRAMALGFQQPGPHLAPLLSDEGRRVVVAAAAALGEDDPSGGLLEAAERWAALATTWEALVGPYGRLFGFTARGPVCACETEYGHEATFHQPHELADLGGYYRAFGLRPQESRSGRPDHVACECEFMEFLYRKDAYLGAQLSLLEPGGRRDLEETLEATRNAARSFLRDHLARFGRAFASHLTREDAEGFYGLLARVFLEVLEVDSARLRVEPGSLSLPLRMVTQDDAPMACGTGDELIQIQRKEDLLASR